MNDEVRNTIHNIIKGAEGQLWQYPDLLQYFQQNYLLIDIHIDVQKPSFKRSLISFIEGERGGNDAA